jgi:hypothetical protein
MRRRVEKVDAFDHHLGRELRHLAVVRLPLPELAADPAHDRHAAALADELRELPSGLVEIADQIGLSSARRAA